MGLDIWFPLAIYYEDLADAEAHNPALLARIHALRAASGEPRTSANSSWTGDVHDVDRLHFDPAFAWLTDQVGAQALRYLKTLGHDLSRIDVYIQRSWPIIGHRDQRVARHAHHTAHFSAVYYVAAPTEGDGGQLRFLNDHRPNELSGGIGSNNTGGYAESNAFNHQSAVYRPVPGRIVLFPAKQTHSVDANLTDEARVSISYDLVVTSRGTADQGHHEFLMPPPSVWRRVDRSEPAMAIGPRADPRIAAGRTALAALARTAEAADAFVIPPCEGHVLWEPRLLPDCVSAAAWEGCAAELADLPEEDWLRDHSGTVSLWAPPVEPPLFRDAVDRLYGDLRAQDVPLDGASLGPPMLQRREAATLAPFRRAKAHLCAYLRLDRDAEASCELHFAEGGGMALPPGALLLVSGARRHRIAGASHILAFDLDLPALARPDALALRGLQDPDAADRAIFAAITAQPLHMALPTGTLLREKLELLDRRARLRHRHADCPATRRFLLDHAEPGSASAEELALIAGHGRGGGDAGQLAVREAMLTREQCAALIGHLEAHLTAIVADTVDGLPEYQVNLSPAELRALTGEAACRALLDLPQTLGGATMAGPARLDIFVRKYSPETRRYISFHSDRCTVTANIALSDDAAVEGGRLLALHRGRLEQVRRDAGTALLHAGDLVHGVSRIERGARYSLILFFSHDAAAQAA